MKSFLNKYGFKMFLICLGVVAFYGYLRAADMAVHAQSPTAGVSPLRQQIDSLPSTPLAHSQMEIQAVKNDLALAHILAKLDKSLTPPKTQKIVRYFLVSHLDAGDMTEEVNKMLSQGWETSGQLAGDGKGYWGQVMTKTTYVPVKP